MLHLWQSKALVFCLAAVVWRRNNAELVEVCSHSIPRVFFALCLQPVYRLQRLSRLVPRQLRRHRCVRRSRHDVISLSPLPAAVCAGEFHESSSARRGITRRITAHQQRMSPATASAYRPTRGTKKNFN